MKRKRLALLLGCLSTATCFACSDNPPRSEAGLRDSRVDSGRADVVLGDTGLPRYYQHLISNCAPDPLVNCRPSLQLCRGGKAIILVTDVINAGSYAENDQGVATTWPAADVPESMFFTWTNGGQSLVDDWQGWTWDFVPSPLTPSCLD